MGQRQRGLVGRTHGARGGSGLLAIHLLADFAQVRLVLLERHGGTVAGSKPFEPTGFLDRIDPVRVVKVG